MAEYIDREDVYNTLKAMYCDECTDEKCQMCEYAKIMFVLDNLPIADVQPVRKWVNDNISSPSVDGDYLVLYRGYFNVFERFRGKWFDEKGVEVDTNELLWWQELPPMPEAIKG